MPISLHRIPARCVRSLPKSCMRPRIKARRTGQIDINLRGRTAPADPVRRAHSSAVPINRFDSLFAMKPQAAAAVAPRLELDRLPRLVPSHGSRCARHRCARQCSPRSFCVPSCLLIGLKLKRETVWRYSCYSRLGTARRCVETTTPGQVDATRCAASFNERSSTEHRESPFVRFEPRASRRPRAPRAAVRSLLCMPAL